MGCPTGASEAKNVRTVRQGPLRPILRTNDVRRNDVRNPPRLDIAQKYGKCPALSQETGYIGPKPPPARTHNYHFELYALDTMLPVETGVTAVRLQN